MVEQGKNVVKEIESMDSRSNSLRANVVIADCGILEDADGGQGKKGVSINSLPHLHLEKWRD